MTQLERTLTDKQRADLWTDSRGIEARYQREPVEYVYVEPDFAELTQRGVDEYNKRRRYVWWDHYNHGTSEAVIEFGFNLFGWQFKQRLKKYTPNGKWHALYV